LVNIIGSIVNVTGGPITGAATSDSNILTLNIPAGVTVNWGANVSTAASYSTPFVLQGGGAFEFNGVFTNNTNAAAINDGQRLPQAAITTTAW